MILVFNPRGPTESATLIASYNKLSTYDMITEDNNIPFYFRNTLEPSTDNITLVHSTLAPQYSLEPSKGNITVIDINDYRIVFAKDDIPKICATIIVTNMEMETKCPYTCKSETLFVYSDLPLLKVETDGDMITIEV